MNKLALTILLLLVTGLSGCAANSVGGSWSCPASQHDGCDTVAESDERAISKIKEQSSPSFISRPMKMTSEANNSKTENDDLKVDSADKELVNNRMTDPFSMESPTDPKGLRIPEELGAVWIGAYVDEGGNYQPAGWMFIVVEPAKWRLR
jgi:type IV conjugative transfer system lipoprotein TraV